MADSDDEYDRKRRDKFRGERAEATYRGAERITRPRDDWPERDSWARPRPREYGRSGVRDRGYSPSMESAPKRLRHDFYGESYYNHYAPYHQASHRGGNFFREAPSASTAAAEGQQPPMMSFKAFLATQDDNISDSEAIEKYNDYKLEFQRQQLNEFFVAHKDDEWFRLKYHPEDSVNRKEEQMNALKKRVQVFLELMNGGKLNVSIDCNKTNELLKLLDTVVIKLEGGTDEDIAVLEEEYTELEERYKNRKLKDDTKPDTNAPKPEENDKKPETPEKSDVENKTNGDEPASKDEDGEIVDSEPKNEETPTQPIEELPKSDEKEEDKPSEENTDTIEEKDDTVPDTKEETQPEEEKPMETNDEVEKQPKETLKRKRSSSESSNSGSSSSSSDSDEEKEQKEAPEKSAEPEPNQEEVKEENAEKVVEEENKVEEIIETIEDDKPEKPKSLHKTTSIFLRNLAPTITKQEVEAVCGRYDGFLRVALADPQPDRRWLRRGWVTFKRNANIKEICWNLNNIRLRDCELGAIVNRDLSRRIRPINGITAHKQVVRSDIRISAKVALNLDNKSGLWLDSNEAMSKQPVQTFGLVSNNPVLHNITDYLIEEASAEEEELLGLEPTSDTQDSTSIVERDDQLISVLDRIILYLRVVHSVDYYNHCEYPNEDEMPNRCGILHARGPPPTSKTDMTQFLGAPVESKMAAFLPEKAPRTEETSKNESKLVNLSLKDIDAEIDKFVLANTRELAKDKWLCPLSGKKFKGPDFVRKHIFNKHAEKIDEVKKEVEFFNNYLKDPKRPMLPEPVQPKRDEAPTFSHPSYGGGYGRLPPFYNHGYSQRSRGYAPRARGGGGGGGDFRPVIHYRDLDAPREPEEFI